MGCKLSFSLLHSSVMYIASYALGSHWLTLRKFIVSHFPPACTFLDPLDFLLAWSPIIAINFTLYSFILWLYSMCSFSIQEVHLAIFTLFLLASSLTSIAFMEIFIRSIKWETRNLLERSRRYIGVKINIIKVWHAGFLGCTTWLSLVM